MQYKYQSRPRKLLDFLTLEGMKNRRGTRLSKLVDFYDFLLGLPSARYGYQNKKRPTPSGPVS
jgi:hypothetical protein